MEPGTLCQNLYGFGQVSSDWRWIPAHLSIIWHDRLVQHFGGASGLRDRGLLESALARPANLVAYGENVTTHRLAALYGVGVAKAHAFVDGNKRIAFAIMVSFLKAHDQHLDVTEDEATHVMLQVAAGDMTEIALEQWLSAHCR